jgi:hypothetical protein
VTEPDFTPRASGADAAISAGRRLRNKRQLGGAGAAAAVAAFAILVAAHPFSTGDRGSDSLRVAEPPASAAPTPTEGQAEPTESPTSEPTDEPTPEPTPDNGGAEPTPSDEASDPPPSDDDPGVDPTASPDDSYEGPTRISPQPERSTVPYTDSNSCTQDPLAVPGQSVQWCLRYSGDTSVKRGDTARISADLCRLPNQGDGQWQFSDEDGLAFDIGTGSTTFWTSHDGRKVASTEWTVTVSEGTCLRFTTTWDSRDRDGFRVRPGNYYVGYSFSGSSATGGYSSSSSESFTVTP